jgi:hypothetical protein
LCLRFTREVVRVVVFEVYQRSGTCRCGSFYYILCVVFFIAVMLLLIVEFSM